MELITFFFYLFSAVAIASAIIVITARNPVHSVLFLILAFFNAAGIFMLAGAEFLAILLIVVYVGAVMVLFLFVIMMLDIDFESLQSTFLKNLPVGFLIGVIVLVEMVMVGATWSAASEVAIGTASPNPEGTISNTRALGQLIYTKYVFLFETAGMILLVAMIGAITLTLRHREHAKRQDPAAQVARRAEEAIELHDIKPGSGL